MKRKRRLRIFGYRVTLVTLIGLVIVGANVLFALFAPIIAPYGEAQTVGDVWAPPSAEFLMGLDYLGRDIFSRLLYGGRTTIGIAMAVTLLSFTLGSTFGFMAALVGGWLDLAFSRLVDAMMAVPTLISALIILSVMGSSVQVLIITIAILDSTRMFRLSRAVGLTIAAKDYVEVAKLRGEGIPWIIYREIMPNSLPPLVAEFGLRFCFAFLFIASLSFLGLGIQPPYADWGGMVRDNGQAITFAGFAPLFPALAIVQLTIGVNLLVDGFLASRNARQVGA